MMTVRFASAALTLAMLAAGCGDDSTGSGGGGGDDTTATTATATATATATTATATTTSTTTATTTASGSGGEGGGGDEGGGGGVSACVGELSDDYDGADFVANASVELALRGQLSALNAPMAAAETDPEGDLVPTAAELTVLFEAGDPSLADLITPYYADVVRGVFVDFEAAAGNTWEPVDPAVAPGGKYGDNIFDETGRDLRQWVEKGHFDSLFYGHAVDLVTEGLDEAAVDRLLAAYGAHPSFPGDSSADTAEFPDRLAAQYAERRSAKNPADAGLPLDPANPGVYFRVKRDFIEMQAAVAGGCDEERDAAAARVLTAWERDIIAGTVVYYLSSAVALFTSEESTAAEYADALHAVSEGTAFLHGFMESPDDFRTITDDELGDLLTLLEDPYVMVLSPADEATRLLGVIDGLAEVYGFTEAELEAFETNH